MEVTRAKVQWPSTSTPVRRNAVGGQGPVGLGGVWLSWETRR